jgi:hypothetical protein
MDADNITVQKAFLKETTAYVGCVPATKVSKKQFLSHYHTYSPKFYLLLRQSGKEVYNGVENVKNLL